MSKLEPECEDHLKWVTELIRREQVAGTYGVVQVHLKNGKIALARVERTELPKPVEK